jgi:hypothetical protein
MASAEHATPGTAITLSGSGSAFYVMMAGAF